MRILYTTQYMYDVLRYPFGGLEVHVKDLIEHLPADYEIYVFSPDYFRKNYLVLKYQNGKRKAIDFWEYQEHISLWQITSRNYQELLTQIIAYYKIDVVHVQNCIEHTFDIATISKTLGVPCIKSLHDFYDIGGCNFQKDFATRFVTKELLGTPLQDKDVQQQWEDETALFYQEINYALAFSHSTENIYKQFFPHTKYKLIPHGIDLTKKMLADEDYNKRKKIVFCGRISREKGAFELFQLIKSVSAEAFEFHIFGMWEPYLLEEKQALMECSNVKIYGRYTREELAEKYFPAIRPHFALVISDWDETFNYILSEMMILGIIPIATSKGALKERIEESQFGILLKDNKIETLKEIFSYINKQEQQWYEEQLNKAQQFKPMSKKEMIVEYQKLYQELFLLSDRQALGITITRRNKYKTFWYTIFQRILIFIAFSKVWQSTKVFRDKIKKIGGK